MHEVAQALAREVEQLEACCEKVNAIRNSIVGAQQFNFSEHAYPLVAALNAAGFVGEPYPEALANVGTLLERATKAERKLAEVRAVRAHVMLHVAELVRLAQPDHYPRHNDRECVDRETVVLIALRIKAVVDAILDDKGEP